MTERLQMSCRGIIAINGWHNSVVAFDPYHAIRPPPVRSGYHSRNQI